MFTSITRGRIVEKILFYFFLTFVGLVFVYPFIFMVATSLKDSPEVFANLLSLFGARLRFENYATVLGTVNMGHYMINTAIVTLGVTVGQIVTSLLGGYAFARIRFPGRDLIFRLYLGTIMIPFTVIMIPIYKLMLTFGWVDKLQALIVPWLFTAAGTFLMRQFFKGFPIELEEAAYLDGANRFTILWRVFVPLAGPAIATQFTISFLYAWNSFIWPLVAIQSKANYVVTQGLAVIQGGYHASPPLVLAGATLVILPTVIVFLLAQRYFVEGIATTGMKN
ncbi:MAG: carbohydrate ABC transporter permease [Anaerolineaceae bacterium]|nr:carbohydrate ABC transporter permease [Anaerolineaceae bacterium]